MCNLVKPGGLQLYSHICLHAVWSMAPKCTSVVTLTVNSCGWDHTNYPRHASNHSLPCTMISQLQGYLSICTIISHLSQIARISSLNMCTMTCLLQVCFWYLTSSSRGSYGLSSTGCIHSTPSSIYMHFDIPTCEAGPLMMHLNMHAEWYLSVFVWWWRWWCCHDNTNDPKHSLCNQLCRLTLLHPGPGNGQSVHMWWFTLSWGHQCRATPKHMFPSYDWWSSSLKTAGGLLNSM